MAVTDRVTEVYQKIWQLLVADPDFSNPTLGNVRPGNRIDITNGKLQPQKTTARQPGDLFEVEILAGTQEDKGDPDPTFGVVQGDCPASDVFEQKYYIYVTKPDPRLNKNAPLFEIIRRNLRGYILKNSGLAYCGNVSLETDEDDEVEHEGVTRMRQRIVVTVPIEP